MWMPREYHQRDAAERVEHEAKRAIAAIHEGDML